MRHQCHGVKYKKERHTSSAAAQVAAEQFQNETALVYKSFRLSPRFEATHRKRRRQVEMCDIHRLPTTKQSIHPPPTARQENTLQRAQIFFSYLEFRQKLC